MKIKLLLITAFSNFYSIQSMSEARKEIDTSIYIPDHHVLATVDSMRINHIFGEEKNRYPIKKKPKLTLDLTKKLTL